VTPVRRLAAVLAAGTLLAGVVLLAGCSGSTEKPAARTPSPFAGCAALTTAPSAPTTAPPAVAGGSKSSAAGRRLPGLELPCFTGDQKVDIGQITGPAVINLWASWCRPCRAELPALQRLAGRYGDRLHVLGVISSDDRAAAQSLAEDLGVTFPALYDRQGALLPRLGGAGLPLTVFVGTGSQITYLHNSAPLDDAALTRLVRQHLGVVVPA
jgi:thiol-disulfide isomerase/thioredoxin